MDKDEAGGMAYHDHSPLHGGVVSMYGDTHVEYVPADDELRFYLSDAHRVAITHDVSGVAMDADKPVMLRFDPKTGMLSGRSKGAGSRKIEVQLTVSGNPFNLVFDPVAQAPTGATVGAATKSPAPP